MRRHSSVPHALLIVALSMLTSSAVASPLNAAFVSARTIDETYLGALANFQATQELVPQAVASLLPNLSVSAQNMSNRLNKDEGAGPLPLQNYKSASRSLTLRQPIIRPAAWVQLKQSSAQVMAAQYELIRAENDLVIRVVSAYIDALLADDQLKAVDTQVKTLQMQQEATLLSFNQGYATRVDIIDLQSRLDQALVDQRQVRSAKGFALEQLRLFSGNTQATPIKIFITNNNRLENFPFAEWLNRAMEKNVDILVSKFRVEAVSQEILKVNAGHLPTLDFIAQVSNSNNENIQFPATTFSNKQVGLQMNVPIFSGGSVMSASRQAVQLANKEDRLLNATMNNVRLQVNKEFNNFIDGIERIKANQTTLLAAQQALISAEKNTTAGYKTRIDVLNALQKVLSSEKDLMLSQYQCMLFFLRLNLLSGESAEQSLIELHKLIQLFD
jgi:TolC family type I secretion outer membrane protein